MAEQNKTKSEDSDVSTHSSGDQPNSLSLPSGDSLNGSITLPKLHHYSLPTIDESPNVAFERLCQEHQETGNQQICQICDRIFPNWYKLKQHLYTHADFKPFACSYCDKTFKNYSKKSRHEKTHSGLKPYVCRICNKHVTRSEHLKRHLLTHTDSHPYKCMVCDYRSRRLDCIRYHMKNKHPENDSKILFNHQVVDANDDHPNDASDLLWQQYKETSASDPLPPSLLPSPEPEAKPFENKPKKKKKKKKAAEVNPAGADTFPNYPIPPESQAISQSPQFPMPMPLPSASIMYGFPKLQTSQPTNSRSMLPHADILSSSKSSGKSPMHHSQSPPGHHSSPHGQHSSPQNAGHVLDSSFSDDEGQQYFIGGESSKTKMELPKSKRKNMCGICEKAFDCPSKLRRHQNTHAGIRPYKCNVCGKQLSRPEHLKRHLATHDPDKPCKGSMSKSPGVAATPKVKRTDHKPTSSKKSQANKNSQNTPLQSANYSLNLAPTPKKHEASKPEAPTSSQPQSEQCKPESTCRMDCKMQKPATAEPRSSAKPECSLPSETRDPNCSVTASGWNQNAMFGAASHSQMARSSLPMSVLPNPQTNPFDCGHLPPTSLQYHPQFGMIPGYPFGASAPNMMPAHANYNIYNRNGGQFAQNMMQNSVQACNMPVFPSMSETS